MALGFLRVKGRQIVEQSGKEVILCGVNLGNWLMMEGYISGGLNKPVHLFAQAFAKKYGQKELAAFLKLYRDTYIQEKDFLRIRQMGANCIRLPFPARLLAAKANYFDESGFTYLKRAVAWARKHSLYLILDLHAAPGSQNQDWHSDSAGRALFWQEEKFQRRYLRIWKEIARRFKNEPAIAGYDVLNEPVVPKNKEGLVKRIYAQVTEVIRSEDKAHIIFLEGNCWGQRIGFLGKPQDANTAYSIHTYLPLEFTFNFARGLKYPGVINKTYWDSRRVEKMIAPYAALGKKWNMPIYVGELGVNLRCGECYGELEFLKDLLSTFKKHHFHWTYWTYKCVAQSCFPDGIYQYLKDPLWINRAGPISGWDSLLLAWPKFKRRIIHSWRTEEFVENKALSAVLKRFM
jgi:hypothetical protein